MYRKISETILVLDKLNVTKSLRKMNPEINSQ